MTTAGELAEWCFQELSNSDEYFIPLHQLWNECCRQFNRIDMAFSDFENLLRSDKRFYLSRNNNSSSNDAQKQLLDRIGLPSNTLIGLAGKRPTGKELDKAIITKANQMLQALQRAWDARPSNDREVERKLLFLMEQAKKLCDMAQTNQAGPG